MNRQQLKLLIKKRYSGEQLDELIDWIESDTFDADLSRFIEQDLHDQLTGNPQNESVDLDFIVEEILTISHMQQEVLASHTTAKRKPTKIRKINDWIKPGLKIAASLILLLSISYVWVEQTYSVADEPVAKPVSYVQKQNPKGRKSTVFLKDGSKVILNSESSITYDENFATGKREILLKGEAFFEVAKDPNRPFIVKSGSISTVALGTSFNVRNYADSDITVSLVTGKVRIDENGEMSSAGVLMPGEKIKYDRESATLEKLKYNDYEDLLWKDGILSFKKATISEVVATLERWYGVEIAVVKPCKKSVSYGAVFKDQSLKQVLQAMGFTLNFDYIINDKKVEIMFNKKHCQ